MKFVDEATIEVTAGKGGNGCVSFRRENLCPRAGPTAVMGEMADPYFLRATTP